MVPKLLLFMLLTSRNELRRHAYTDYEAGTYFPRFVTVSDDGRQYQNEQLPEMTFASVDFHLFAVATVACRGRGRWELTVNMS